MLKTPASPFEINWPLAYHWHRVSVKFGNCAYSNDTLACPQYGGSKLFPKQVSIVLSPEPIINAPIINIVMKAINKSKKFKSPQTSKWLPYMDILSKYVDIELKNLTTQIN